MKTNRVLLALVGALLLGGCATTPEPVAESAEKTLPSLADVQRTAQRCAVDAVEASRDEVSVNTIRKLSVGEVSPDGREMTLEYVYMSPELTVGYEAAINCANEELGIDAPDLPEQITNTYGDAKTERQEHGDVLVEWWPEARGATFDVVVRWQLADSNG